MGCREEHKLVYATYTLGGEVEDWWRFASQTLPQEEGYIHWKAFKACFLGYYFPRDLKKQKAWEFIELKQGNMSVEKYAAKFHELTDFPTLISKCRIFEANSKGKTIDSQIGGLVRQDPRLPRFPKGPYSSANQSQSRGTAFRGGSSSGSNLSRGLLRYFRCGGPHMVRNCSQPPSTYGICGKTRHSANNCWLASQQSRSVSGSNRPTSRASSGMKPNVQGKVFAMSRSKAFKFDELIRGKCIINVRLCDVLFDSGATYFFISMDYVNCVGLPISSLACNVVVSTSTAKSVVTSSVCLGCSVMVHSRNFCIDLICLPLSQLDVVLSMDWLSSNRVLLDCKEKVLIFDDDTLGNSKLLSMSEARNTVETKAFMVLFSAEIDKTMKAEYIPILQDFLEVFPEDVTK
ncbi:uncharacterized protein LOC113849428 [Abrus precatorius]|uniref:Uncharacterized protein LOC113849428 n=1 Tax=Abrus precatorius TaxID=3816 RepID=A0A8B8JUF2_ABRPR|nr:uncharacterized protein LOC113849428 [Abrus precatorius]